MTETNSPNEGELRMAALEEFKLAGAANGVPAETSGDAISLMGGFYAQLGMGSDPIVAGAMQRARLGLQEGVKGISDPDLRLAIDTYAGKFEDAYNTSTVEQILTFVGNNGYTNALPDKLQAVAEANKQTILSALDMNDPGQKALVIAAQILRNDVDRVSLIPGVIRQNTTKGLEGLAESLPDPTA
jgi:hypothetical protein